VKQGLSLLLSLGCYTIAQGICSLSTTAQVTSDGTTDTNVDANGNNFTINQGDRAGDNLFHSFQDFSVPNGGSAFFDNAADIVNIFSRVTGGNISNIDGLLRANGSANLFLINPAGILFGEGARLDIGGSFYGSSADSILFEDGEFSATDLENPPLLTVNAPIGLSLRDNPQPIVNQSRADNVGLQVDVGKSIILVGGDIDLQGGLITASAGNVQLGGLSETGKIDITEDGISFPENVARNNVSLAQEAFVDVSGTEGGNISVNASNLEISGNSELQTGTFADTGLPGGQSGDIILNATGAVEIDASTLDAGVETGNAGNINIEAQDSISIDKSFITAENFGTGFAGGINLDALNEISIEDSRIEAEGNFGRIFIGNSIQPSKVTFEGTRTITEDGSEFSNLISTTSSNSDDLAGKITINARDSIDVIGSGIQSITQTTRTTDINDREGLNFSTISLKVAEDNSTGTITINQSEISTTNFEIGFAGDIILNAGEKIETLDSSIFSRGNFGRILIGRSDISGETSSPKEITLNNSFLTVSNDSIENASETQINAGEISIDAVNNISFVNGSQISTETQRLGNAGNLTISSENGSVFLDKSNVFSNVNPGGIGNAGDINITASDSISFTNGAELQSGIVANKINDDFLDSISSGRGNGGNITLEATESITLSDRNSEDSQVGSGIFADVEEGASGDAGNIIITTGSLFLSDRGLLNTQSLGLGQGGNITLNIDDTLTMRNNSIISAQALNDANGGNININAPNGFVVAFPSNFDGNDIIASADRGEGGNIQITAQSVFGIKERPLNPLTNDINASSQFGLDGSISIFTPDVNAIQRDTDLPTNPIQSEQTVAEACRSELASGQSSGLVVKGKGGIPPQPIEPLNSDATLVDGQLTNPNSQSQHPEIKPIKTSVGDIYPARGVIVKENGDVILTAYPTDGIDTRTPDIQANCS
jgi:filamentous hemagglutinin family protein